MSEMGRITLLLADLKRGDKRALDRLIPIVYAELHRMASGYLRGEYPGHTLQPTALVHEAYLRLVGHEEPAYQNRSHFYAVVAKVMRHILVDHARRANAVKRGSGDAKVPLEEALVLPTQRPAVVVAINDALEQLRNDDERKAQLLELRFFGGLTAEESAEVVGLPVNTVRRELRVAQAWLRRELDRGCACAPE